MKNNRIVSLLLVAILTTNCTIKSNSDGASTSTKELKISLAQWSIHRALEAGQLNADDFPSIAKNDYGITAVEYVNQFYKAHATDTAYRQAMRKKTDSLGVKNLLIMVDEEGNLGSADVSARQTAVKNHYKWVDAAAILGCHSIRLNAFGEGTKEEMQAAMIESLKELCSYAATKNINVLIENHGLYSSDGQWVAGVMKGVNMPNCGTLPDFGNWCTSHKWGSTETGKECNSEYDRYQGVRDLLPYAKGVSAKSYTFDEDGNETIIDYKRLLKIIKDSDFDGYIGIEYDGAHTAEPDGILATKALIEKVWRELD